MVDAARTMLEGLAMPDDLRQQILDSLDFTQDFQQRMDSAEEALRTGLERMKDTQQRIADQMTAGRSARDLRTQYGREDLLTGESRQQAESDFARNQGRRMADLQRQYAQRVADIQRQGGPNAHQQMTDAARQYQQSVADQQRQTAQQQADMAERFALEDRNRERQRQWAAEDAAQRMADIAADKERAKANQAALDLEQKRLQAPIDRLTVEKETRTLAQQVAQARDSEYQTLQRITAELQKQVDLARVKARAETGRDFSAGGGFPGGGAPGSEQLVIEDVNIDGDKAGTLIARRTSNRLQTVTSVMGQV